MAGYGAVVSLQQTIERILQSSRISLDPPSADIIQIICRELESLEEILKRLDSISPRKSRKKVNALDGRIKEAVWRFEDLLESHLSHQILSHHSERDSDGVLSFSMDLLRNDVGPFMETVMDMENKYIDELDNMPQVEEDDQLECVSSSRSSSFGGMKAKMVGFSDPFFNLRLYLTAYADSCLIYPVVGMPGSGKTTLAENLFQDPKVVRVFDHRVWITVGRKYDFNDIARRIVAQLDIHTHEIPQHKNCFNQDDEKKIREYLRGSRSLIVLDNVWDSEVIDYVSTLLPGHNHAMIRILLTTNLEKVAEHLHVFLHRAIGTMKPLNEPKREDHMFKPTIMSAITMKPLNKQESEDLLRMKVFGEEVEDFPPRLEKAAKKIAKNCKGLPLMIVTVADLLLKANKNDDLEFWNEVAENPNSDVMMNAHNQVSKVLFPVYDCSPQSSKMLYLYMAAFPQDTEIGASKLINMLTAEGFLTKTLHNSFHWKRDLSTMVSTTILICEGKTANIHSIKTVRLNSSWCYLFNKESSKDKFLLLLKSGCVGALEQHMKGQRRLCLHANFVLNFKEVYNSVKYDCASTARSLLCFGPYHPYSMPLDVGFKLLRVLDALKVHFYTFPVEIIELVLLQYLALTYNGELPTSISKLFNLQFLIIHPHVSIKSCGALSYVPVQIWDMQELKYIEILGRNLPNPEHGASLQKLSTLIGVSVRSCTREVLEGLPNIRKLEIQIELTPSGDDDLNFDYIWEVKNLETLKCSSIVSPKVKCECVSLPKPISLFPSSLQKLHLSGFGYPWKYMKPIGEIPNLRVLKLRDYAFKGPKWETESNSFLQLQYLVIEDTDLVQWKHSSGSFPKLGYLRMKHCYKLQEFNWSCDVDCGRIELVDCNPLAVTSAKQAKPRNDFFNQVKVFVSFDGEELN